MSDRRRAAAAFALLLALVAPSSVTGQRAEPAALACADAALPAAILAGPATLAPRKALKTVSLDAPRARLTLAIAGTSATRELGLMCVTHLRPHAGMIFVFSQAARWEFWMKNTLVSLDMIWVGGDGTVDAVAANVPPSTLETSDEDVARRSGDGLYVIELAAGEAASDGIVKGLRFRLPARGIH